MARTTSSRKQAAARLLLILLILSLFLSVLPERLALPLRRTVDTPAGLAQMSAARLARWVSVPFRGVASYWAEGSELSDLRERVERLETENLMLRQRLGAANRKLDALGAAGADHEYPRVVADVAGGDAGLWRGSLVVSAGARVGVRPEMPVVWGGAVVGMVATVSPLSSRVMLLTDPAFRGAVRFAESGARGILVGTGAGRCRVEYVSHDTEVVPGEAVATAGVDGIFPPGFLVGRCARVSRESGELALDIEVEPAVNAIGLESVEILLWTAPDAPPRIPGALRGP